MFSTLIFRRIDPRRRAVLQFKIHRMLSVSGASDVTCCESGSAMSLMSVLAIGAWHKRPGCWSWCWLGERVKTLATSDLASQGKCVSVSCHWEKLSTLKENDIFLLLGKIWTQLRSGRGILSEWVCSSSGPLSTPGHWLRYSQDSALTVFVFKSRVNVTSPGPLPSPCLPQILSTSLDSQTSAIVRAGRGGDAAETDKQHFSPGPV